MGSQRGSGVMSESQSKDAQQAFTPSQNKEPSTVVSPSSLIKRRVKPDAANAANQQDNKNIKPNQ